METQKKFEIFDLKKSHLFEEISIKVDIRNKAELRRNLKNSAVINLAAVHRDDITNPDEYYSTNVEGARILCEVCEEKGINKIVFTSSVAVYGFAHPGTEGRGGYKSL